MNKAQKLMSFQEFLATQSVNVTLGGYIVNLLLCCLLVLALAFIYTKFSKTISNRKQFAHNLPLIALTTMIIITIVKSSLALSLGLVGALSIVRFRTAIKEPEELAYLFLSISIGLGMGANQGILTIIGFLVVVAFILLRYLLQKKRGDHDANLYLIVSHPTNEKLILDDVTAQLAKYCTVLKLKRFDKNEKTVESSFQVEFKNYEAFRLAVAAFMELDAQLKISVVDNSGLF